MSLQWVVLQKLPHLEKQRIHGMKNTYLADHQVDLLQQLLQDALDDALLLGCSEQMVRDAFQQALDHLQPTVSEDDGV